VLSEIIKALVYRGIDPQVYFWRSIAGAEVDIVVDIDGKLVPIKVKVSATPDHGIRNKNITKGPGGKVNAGVRGASRQCQAAPWTGRVGSAVRETLACVEISERESDPLSTQNSVQWRSVAH